jgi:hypothetical protein
MKSQFYFKWIVVALALVAAVVLVWLMRLDPSPPRLMRGVASVVEDVPIEIRRSQHSDLARIMKIRIIQALHLDRGDEGYDFSLGAFRLTEDSGEFQSICDLYDTVEVTWRAEGVAVSGESPMMQMKYACQYELGMDAIAPVSIPVKRLQMESATVASLSVGNIEFTFLNQADEWAREWHLDAIRLSGKQVLSLTRYEINYVNAKPVVVDFSSLRTLIQ